MKITVTSYYLPPTDRIGAGVQAHMIANEYCKLGHDVTVLSAAQIRDSAAQYKLESVKLVGKNRIVGWAMFLAKYKFDADMVHFTGDDFLVRSNKSYLHMRTFMGSCLAEAAAANTLREKFRMTYLGLTEVVSSLRFPITTVISADTNRYLLRSGTVVSCGVDLESFKPGDSKSPNPSILFVGTLDSRKRGRHLVRQYCQVVKEIIPNAELWIVRESQQLDIPGVTMFGSVSQEKLIELYQKAWVFCLPSQYEGFGVPYIEAMACGTPVVATPNPGALEVLKNGQYGLLADIDQIGITLATLLTNEEKRTDLSAGALRRVREYQINEVASHYIRLATEYSRKQERY